MPLFRNTSLCVNEYSKRVYMRVLLSKIEIHIPYATSLKDKRRVIKGLKDKIWSRFRASISEVDGHDSRQVAILGLSYVSNDSTLLE